MTRQWDRLPPEARDYLDETGKSLMFVCTDRGQHARTALGTAASLDGKRPRLWLSIKRERVQRLALLEQGGVFMDDNRTVHVRCPRCGRDPQWREARAEAIVDDLLAAGITEVDISVIP